MEMTPGNYIKAIEFAQSLGAIDLRGNCRQVAVALQNSFPDLELVWGWVNCDRHEQWPHWYLKAPDGTIYDPTRSQFTEIKGYGEWVGRVPEGRCRYCLGLVYPGELCQKEMCAGP
jgi:hypothetical protein